MSGPFQLPTEKVAELCRSYGVQRLVVFGSATGDQFDPQRSDVDFLVEFQPAVEATFATYFGLKTALNELLNRPVDLVMSKALSNPYFAQQVRRTERELYAA